MYWESYDKKIKGNLNFKRKRRKISMIRVVICVLPLVIVALSVITVVFAVDCEKKFNATKTAVSNEIVYEDQDENKNILFVVNDIQKLDKDYSANIISCEGVSCSEVVKKDLERLLADAKKQGYELELTCGYTTASEQQHMYDQKVESMMKENPSYTKVKAIIETSKFMGTQDSDEHRTGLLLDFKLKGESSESFKDSAAYDWMLKNAFKYGFILRFPELKEIRTRMYFNPNAFRYVGVHHAKKMQMTGMCLEEYMNY